MLTIKVEHWVSACDHRKSLDCLSMEKAYDRLSRKGTAMVMYFFSCVIMASPNCQVVSIQACFLPSRQLNTIPLVMLEGMYRLE